jgi:hypothetical protein
LEWPRLGGNGRSRGRFYGFLFEERCQVCLRDAHSLGHLDQSAIIQAEFVPLVQLVAVLVVCVAQKIPRLVIDHDPVVEGVELQVAILPTLLLPSDIVGEQTSEFGDGRRVL